jgi:hypothetical protein
VVKYGQQTTSIKELFWNPLIKPRMKLERKSHCIKILWSTKQKILCCEDDSILVKVP